MLISNSTHRTQIGQLERTLPEVATEQLDDDPTWIPNPTPASDPGWNYPSPVA